MANLIGTASVKISGDTSGFKQQVQRDVGEGLRESIKGDELKPGLEENEAAAKKSSLNIKGFFAAAFASIKTLAVAGLVSIGPALANSLIPLLGALGILPGLAATGGAAIATLTVGLHGFFSALGDEGNAKAFNEDLKNLAPNAQRAAKTLAGFAPAFKQMQLSVQNTLFRGLNGAISQLASGALPLLGNGLTSVASSLNIAAKNLLAFLSSASTKNNIGTIFSQAAVVVRNFADAIAPIGQAFLSVAAVSAQAFARLTSVVGDVANQFNAFIQRVVSNGQLFNWIEQGLSVLGELGDIALQVGQIILTVIKGLDTSGGSFLDILQQLVTNMANFLKSAAGQSALQAIEQVMAAIGSNVGPLFAALLSNVATILVQLSPFLVTVVNLIGSGLVSALQIAGPLLSGLAGFLSQNAQTLGPLTVALTGLFLVFKGFTIIREFIAGLALAKVAMVAFGEAEGIVAGITAALDAVLDANIFAVIALAVVAVATLIITHWTQIKTFLTAAWTAISGVAKSVWNGIVNVFHTVIGAISSAFTAFVSTVGSIVSSILGFFSALPGRIGSFLASLPGIIGNALLAALKFGANAVLQGIEWIIAEIIVLPVQIALVLFKLGEIIGGAFVTAFIAAKNAVVAGISALVTFFSALPGKILQAIIALAAYLVVWFTTAWHQLQNSATNLVANTISFFSALPGRIISALKSLGGALLSFITGAWHAFTSGLSTAVSATITFVKSIPGRLLSALGDLGNLLLGAGKAIINGFLNGLKAAIGAVWDFFKGIGSKIASLKGPLDYDKILLVPHGKAIMDGFLNGLKSRSNALDSFLVNTTQGVNDAFATTGTLNLGSGSNGSGPGAGGVGTAGTASGGVNVNITAIQQQGQDVNQFASAVYLSGARALASAASTLGVTQQPVQVGSTNNVVPVGALA